MKRFLFVQHLVFLKMTHIDSDKRHDRNYQAINESKSKFSLMGNMSSMTDKKQQHIYTIYSVFLMLLSVDWLFNFFFIIML